MSRIRAWVSGVANAVLGKQRPPASTELDEIVRVLLGIRNWTVRHQDIKDIFQRLEVGRDLEAAHMTLTSSILYWGSAEDYDWSSVQAAFNNLLYILERNIVGRICQGDSELYRFVSTGGRFFGPDYTENGQDKEHKAQMDELYDELSIKAEALSKTDVDTILSHSSLVRACLRQILGYVKPEHINERPVAIFSGGLPSQQAFGVPPMNTQDYRRRDGNERPVPQL